VKGIVIVENETIYVEMNKCPDIEVGEYNGESIVMISFDKHNIIIKMPFKRKQLNYLQALGKGLMNISAVNIKALKTLKIK
jgi:hypothetical protein